jgi:hypothetical protein
VPRHIVSQIVAELATVFHDVFPAYDASPMALQYDLDAAQQIVTITGDYAEPEEWRALLVALAQDPNYPGGYSFLRDVRASVRPVTAQSVMGIIALVREFWEQLKVHRAAIVTRPAIDAPAMIAHALAEDQRIPLRAFNSYDDALAWLKDDRPSRVV